MGQLILAGLGLALGFRLWVGFRCVPPVFILGPILQGPQGPEESSFPGRSQDLEGKTTHTSMFKALTRVIPAHIPMAKESHAAEPSTAEREGCTLSSGGRGQWLFAEQCYSSLSLCQGPGTSPTYLRFPHLWDRKCLS